MMDYKGERVTRGGKQGDLLYIIATPLPILRPVIATTQNAVMNPKRRSILQKGLRAKKNAKATEQMRRRFPVPTLWWRGGKITRIQSD